MELPPERRYSVRLTAPDGQGRRLGRVRVRFTDAGEVQVLNRRRTVLESFRLSDARRDASGKAWLLTTEDGSLLELADCGCGS